MTDLHFKSAIELAALVRERKVGCLELLDHFLARVDKYNPGLNAIIWMDCDSARNRAREADAALARGEAWGPLHGVPMTIKESYQVAGSPTTWGIPDFANNVTDTTAVAAQRMIDAGVTLFGKTNVPVMLADWQSFNPIYGVTKNPWNPDVTPGGSSGGSSAALAAGLTGIEAGSDIGSSIRNPAHYCGVFGHKPTLDVISNRGHSLPGVFAKADISVVGPLARSAADLDLALDIMGGHDPIEAEYWRLSLPACGKRSLKEFRVAVKLSDAACEVDGEYAGKLQDFVDALAKAGAQVKEAEPEIDTRRLSEIYLLLLNAAMGARTPEAVIETWKEALAAATPEREPYLAHQVAGATLSHRQWLALNNERHAMRLKFNAFFRDFDVLLCPVVASAAFPHQHTGEMWERKLTINNKRVPATDQLFWAGYSGVVFLPSTVGPAGFVRSGLPVGYQAIAGQGRDKTSIAFARAAEREIGGFVPPPLS